MNILPLESPQIFEISLSLGEALLLYQNTNRVEEVKARIALLQEKAKSPEVKATLAAILSLVSRNVNLTQETFKRDCETERHYLELFQKKAHENEAQLQAQKDRLKTIRGQLSALQQEKAGK